MAKRSGATADAPASRTPPADHAAPAPGTKAPRAGSAAALSEAILAGTGDPGLSHYARALADPDKTTAGLAARVVQTVAQGRPGLVTPHTDRLIGALASTHLPVTRACADTLAELAAVTPARIAKHADALKAAWADAGEVARDGILRTWVALCAASIAYQPRLVGAITEALEVADPKTLGRWALLALPVLKGEPHAQARAVVERRVDELPKRAAKQLSAALGIELRTSRPG